jgi:Domain of unknown function (DUF4832)
MSVKNPITLPEKTNLRGGRQCGQQTQKTITLLCRKDGLRRGGDAPVARNGWEFRLRRGVAATIPASFLQSTITSAPACCRVWYYAFVCKSRIQRGVWIRQPVVLKISKFVACVILTAFFGCRALAVSGPTNFYSLVYASAPPDNPLKGFMPYTGYYSTFSYSMEWSYLPLRSLMTGPTNFDWSSLDSLLSTDAVRGHQTVFRVYLDYPGQPTGIPQYLLDDGLATYSYTNYGNTTSVSPDYENPLLDQAMTNFIAALGARYDGDPRIGFIELGLLGFWGEWHTYPVTNLFASVQVQEEVIVAYTNAFHKTKLLVRYPTVLGGLNPNTLPLGYHDDSFAYDTIAPPSYNFLGLMATVFETNKWRTQPIGGEVYPDVQSCMWDQLTCVPDGQEFSNCVAAAHASWMLNQYVFDPGFSGTQQALALAGAHQMGYELYVSNAIVVDPSGAGPLTVTVVILNTGVAPFYYDWPVQLAVLNGSNEVVKVWTTPWKLSSLFPGTNTILTYAQTNPGLPAGQYKLLMGVQNPMANGIPLRFADLAQDADLVGWLTLGQFSVLPAPPTLSGSLVPSGIFLQVAGAAPGMWAIEDTTNFLTWTSLLTTNTSMAQWNFTDEVLSPMRFYRVVSQP